MDLGLHGKRVIVTGGSRGIGKAIVQTFVDEGACVATCARGEAALKSAIAAWQSNGATVYGESVDVRDRVAFEAWFQRAIEHLGGLDVFISNVSATGTAEGIQRWEDAFNLDVVQHVRATELALPHLKQSDQPAIVYVGSIASVMTNNMPSEVEYGAMKAALTSYAAQLATTVGKDNIRVNVVSPGPIHHEDGFWDYIKQHEPDLYRRAEAISVFDRLGSPEEVAATVVFLASCKASNITGVNLRVDGGAIKTVNF